MVLAPIAIGMLTNKFFPKFVKAILPFAPVVGVVSTCLLVASAVAQVAEPILNAGISLQVRYMSTLVLCVWIAELKRHKPDRLIVPPINYYLIFSHSLDCRCFLSPIDSRSLVTLVGWFGRILHPPHDGFRGSRLAHHGH